MAMAPLVISPDEAYASIDISILALLFGTMVVSVYLERADTFEYLVKLLSWKSQGAKDLIFRVCLVSAITSALFTNEDGEDAYAEIVAESETSYWICKARRASKLYVLKSPRDDRWIGYAKLSLYLRTRLLMAILDIGVMLVRVNTNISWTAITAALALLVLDFKDAQPSLERVSYSLLVFFCGMFMTIDGFEKTGIPNYLWELMEPYAQIKHVSGVAILALIIIMLSNCVSNVNNCCIAWEEHRNVSCRYFTRICEEDMADISLVGSAANMTVCEQARRAPTFAHNLSFWSHLKIGVPSTIIVTVAGPGMIIFFT
ncbi:arsenite transport protein, putative [Ricinus communis]|uniref:Arsenite transport protein, putative n=1 Tax=Ricinus communis TaxID=3988 RepID=B9RIV8_RICCO|nr:arsenite transport protein, putative [Ricinus communis]